MPTSRPTKTNWWELVLPVLAVIGIADSGYLTYEHYTPSVAPCAPGFFSNCGSVLNSEYAIMFGLPLAVWGLMYYMGILFLFVSSWVTGHILWRRLILAGTFVGFVFSVYLVYLQLGVIGAVCIYCMVSAFTSTLLFITARLAYADECKEHLILFMKYGYQYVKKPFLFMLDPEFVHVVFTRFGEFVGMCPCMRGVLRFILSYRHPSLEQRVAGMTFSNPLGLSAGFDYEARLTQVLPAIGFGFGTVGTITNKFYEGNEKPRLGRLKKSRSLFVNKGFKNAGIDAGITKLEDYQFEIPIGISIGRTNDGSCDTVEKSVDDIVQAFKKVEKSKLKNSYYELNISCPNLKGNVSFYPPENLRKLLQAVEKMKIKRPIFVKMPIGKSDKEFLAMLKVITNFSVAGIIIGNLQRDRSNKAFIAEEVSQWNKGNFSGKPTEEDANRHIALAYKKYGTKLIIIGCGGVFSAEDAYEKIKHGATLVQMITGMIFEGPQVMTEINRGLVQLLERDGYKHVSEVVGK